MAATKINVQDSLCRLIVIIYTIQTPFLNANNDVINNDVIDNDVITPTDGNL